MPNKFLILVLSGLLGAAELAMTCHFCLQVFAPHLISDNDYGDIFLITTPVGALLGSFIAPGAGCLKWCQIGAPLFLKAWLAASTVGVPISFGAAMFISMGPVWYLYSVYAIQFVVMLVALAVIHRSIRAKNELSKI